jgi:hypothetical protein
VTVPHSSFQPVPDMKTRLLTPASTVLVLNALLFLVVPTVCRAVDLGGHVGVKYDHPYGGVHEGLFLQKDLALIYQPGQLSERGEADHPIAAMSGESSFKVDWQRRSLANGEWYNASCKVSARAWKTGAFNEGTTIDGTIRELYAWPRADHYIDLGLQQRRVDEGETDYTGTSLNVRFRIKMVMNINHTQNTVLSIAGYFGPPPGQPTPAWQIVYVNNSDTALIQNNLVIEQWTPTLAFGVNIPGATRNMQMKADSIARCYNRLSYASIPVSVQADAQLYVSGYQVLDPQGNLLWEYSADANGTPDDKWALVFRDGSGGGSEGDFKSMAMGAPAGPQDGTLTLTPASPFTPSTPLTVTFANWTSPNLPLTYEVLVDGQVVSPVGSNAVRTFTGPANPGPHELTGRVRGANGVTTELSQTFSVNAPPSPTVVPLNGGLEPLELLGGGVPTSYGDWAGDQAKIVTAENGITPHEGSHMARILGTEPGGAGTDSEGNLIQLVDLTAYAAQIAAGNLPLTVSARANRVAGTGNTDNGFAIRVIARSGSPGSSTDLLTNTTTINTDANPATWEVMLNTLTLPAGTTHLHLNVMALENVSASSSPPEFDGHYVDDVRIAIGGLVRPSSALLDYTFNSGLVPAGAATYGTATVSGTGGVGDSGVLKVVNAVNGQQGNLVISEFSGGTAQTGFLAAWDMRLGGGSSPPADGMSFNWAVDLPNAVSGDENGAGSGLSICFKLYTSPGIHIRWAGTTLAVLSVPYTSLVTGSGYVPAIVRLDADGLVRVAYNGLSVSAYIPGWTSLAGGKFSFAGRTGGYNVNAWADNLAIQTFPGAPLQTFTNAMNTAGLSGPSAAPDAIPHHDGVKNLLKYAFNMNLAAADSATMPPSGNSGLPGITAQLNGANSIFRFEFLRRKNSGLIYTPQKSGELTNPASWVPLTDTPTVIPIDANWERLIYEEPYNATLIPRCFGRVQVTLPQ